MTQKACSTVLDALRSCALYRAQIAVGAATGLLYVLYWQWTPPRLRAEWLPAFALAVALVGGRTLGLTAPRAAAAAVGRHGASARTAAGRRILFAHLFFIAFFILFDLGSSAQAAANTFFFSDSAPTVGIYFSTVLFSSALFLFHLSVARLMALPLWPALWHLLESAALIVALGALFAASLDRPIYPIVINTAAGLVTAHLFSAPDAIALAGPSRSAEAPR